MNKILDIANSVVEITTEIEKVKKDINELEETLSCLFERLELKKTELSQTVQQVCNTIQKSDGQSQTSNKIDEKLSNEVVNLQNENPKDEKVPNESSEIENPKETIQPVSPFLECCSDIERLQSMFEKIDKIINDFYYPYKYFDKRDTMERSGYIPKKTILSDIEKVLHPERYSELNENESDPNTFNYKTLQNAYETPKNKFSL